MAQPPDPPMFSRRAMILGAAAAVPAGALVLTAASRAKRAAAQPAGALTPEMFGAKGDGVTNDTAALAMLAQAINSAAGGVVSFASGKTYIVGGQSLNEDPKSRYLFEPHDVMVFNDCSKPLTILGNGARLKCAPELRYGTFNRSGRRTDNPMPFTGRGQGASPYRYMIRIDGCSGAIELTDLELDGNLGALTIGGKFGDKGWQLAASGLGLFNNRGSETIRNLHSHHHARDGVLIDGVDQPVAGAARRIIGVRSEYNGRQGCSVVGGRGYRFESCRFNHTGKGGLFSAPGAGVDIEAERGKTNRDFHFVDCEFADNSGAGMVADSGDSEGALFENCKFVGTTGWAAWPKKPRFRFRECTFVGPIVQTYRDEDPERAAQFHSCRFTDDPRLSPTGQVHARKATSPIADLGAGDLNVLFSRCRFDLVGQLVLPWSRNAIYANCRMRQASPRAAHPRGTYIGKNVLAGNINLDGSTIRGEVILNGLIVPRSI